MKLSAWLVTIVGVVWLLPLLGVAALTANTANWIIGLAFLVMGLNKLMKEYQAKGKRR